MGLLNRIGNVFKANVNSVVEKMENPEKILEQNINDMEKEYMKAKESTGIAKAEEMRLDKRIEFLNEEIEKWHKNAKLALDSQDEELAKKALAKRNKNQEELELILLDKGSISSSVNSLVSDLKLMEKKISEAKSKKTLLKTRLETAKAKKKIMKTKNSIDGIGEGAFSSFSKMEEKANRMINEADAMEGINQELKGEDLEEQFKEIKNSSKLDSDLEELKKSL